MIFNKRTGIIFLACAVIIAGAIFAWLSRKRLQIIEKEHANLAAQITTLKTRLQNAGQELEQAKADLNDETSAITSEDITALTAAMMSRSNANFQERMKNDPRFQENYYKKIQWILKKPYSVFLAREHLTPGQTDKFIKALTQREMDKGDLQMALQEQGLSINDPGSLVIIQQLQAAFQQSIENILGSDGYARFETYDRQSSIRQMMGEYAAQSDLIGSPMTSDQVEQMVDYISQNNSDFQNGKDVNPNQIDWPAVDEQARKIMTPEQYDFFTRADVMSGSGASRWRQKLNLAIDAITTGGNQTPGAAPAQ